MVQAGLYRGLTVNHQLYLKLQNRSLTQRNIYLQHARPIAHKMMQPQVTEVDHCEKITVGDSLPHIRRMATHIYQRIKKNNNPAWGFLRFTYNVVLFLSNQKNSGMNFKEATDDYKEEPARVRRSCGYFETLLAMFDCPILSPRL